MFLSSFPSRRILFANPTSPIIETVDKGEIPDRFGLRTPPILSGTLCIAATVIVTVIALAGRSCPTLGFRLCVGDSIDYVVLRSVCSTPYRTPKKNPEPSRTAQPGIVPSIERCPRIQGYGVHVHGGEGSTDCPPQTRNDDEDPLIITAGTDLFLIDRQMARRTSRTRS